MRVALAAAILGALGAIVATIWVGSKVREETVVPNPYEEGLRHTIAPGACELGEGACSATVLGRTVTVELAPRPLRTMRELRVTVTVRDAAGAPVEGARVAVGFEMPGMEMGENVVVLAGAGGGRYTGKGVIVRCASGRRDWQARVDVAPPGGERGAVVLPLRVAE
jgi:hypothetical protein